MFSVRENTGRDICARSANKYATDVLLGDERLVFLVSSVFSLLRAAQYHMTTTLSAIERGNRDASA